MTTEATVFSISTTSSEEEWTDSFPDYARPGPISLGVTAISTTIIGVIFVCFLLRAKRKKISMKRSDFIWAFLCILAMLFYSIHYTSTSLYGAIHNDNETFNTNWCLVYWENGKWLSMSKVFAYLFFLCKYIFLCSKQ